MRIYNSNNQINFGRVIKITSQSNPLIKGTDRKIDDSTHEIVQVLNSEKTKNYTQDEATKIRAFFKNILGDYNGKNGIIMRKAFNEDIILLSGQDAKDIKNIEEESKKEKYRNRKLNNHYNIHFYADKEIKKRVENGKYPKPLTILEFKNSNLNLSQEQKYPKNIKFNTFNYSLQNKSFICIKDGHICEDVPPTSNQTDTNKFMNFEYEENKLEL